MDDYINIQLDGVITHPCTKHNGDFTNYILYIWLWDVMIYQCPNCIMNNDSDWAEPE